MFFRVGHFFVAPKLFGRKVSYLNYKCVLLKLYHYKQSDRDWETH